jgi:hypothetical protein
VALLSNISEDHLKQEITALRRAKAEMLLDEIRRNSKNSGPFHLPYSPLFAVLNGLNVIYT